MNTSTITGIYFDGQSSRPYTVDIELMADRICFGNNTVDSFIPEQSVGIEDLKKTDFSTTNAVQIQFGEFPFQSLRIENAEDITIFKNHYPQFHQATVYDRILKGNVAKVFGVSLISLVGIVALYLMVIAPFIAARAVDLVPKVAEIKLGEKMTEPLFATLDIDEEKSEQLNLFFEKAGFKSEYPVELYVSDEDVVNAFAVPGGKIVVFQGILDAFESWEELAAVLAHELAHVEKRHSLKQMSRSLSTYLVISIMTSDVSGVTAVFLENSFKLKDLSNSRGMETEADMMGYQYLKDLSIDPSGMVNLFKTLQKQEAEMGENGAEIMKILSTHPLSEDRIEYLQETLEKDGTTTYEERPELEALFLSLQSEGVSDDFEE